jgi:7-keto-8-aminopelargonate synthetase-like enzyme
LDSQKFSFICSPIVASAMKAIDLIENDASLPGRVLENAKYFRDEMQKLGFKVAIDKIDFSNIDLIEI